MRLLDHFIVAELVKFRVVVVIGQHVANQRTAFQVVVADLNDLEIFVVFLAAERLVAELVVLILVGHGCEQFGVVVRAEVAVGERFVIVAGFEHARKLVLAEQLLVFGHVIIGQRAR